MPVIAPPPPATRPTSSPSTPTPKPAPAESEDGKAVRTCIMCFDDFLRSPEAESHELVDGVLEEKHVGLRESKVAARFIRLLDTYVESHTLGDVFTSDALYRMFPERPDTGRRPDVSFVARGRLSPEQINTGYATLPPDLAVEVVSPNDSFYEVETKIADYLNAGVRLVWIINPEQRTVTVRRPDNTATVVGESDRLDGGDVLPGFSADVKDLFPQPPATPAEGAAGSETQPTT